MLEHELNLRGVSSVFNQFIINFEIDGYSSNLEAGNALMRMVKLRYQNDAPRQPPRIIIQGQPGSGRSTQAAMIAQKFGIVKVSANELL